MNKRIIRIAFFLIASSTMLLSFAVADAMAQTKLDVPVVVGVDAELDPCAVGVIAGLDPRGDGFLSVRSGPAANYRELDRLKNGNRVHLCDQKGDWIGVVYGAAVDKCGVGTPWPKKKAYAGPCKHGWVHTRYVKPIAG
jgi:hypothetical protein